MRRRAVRHLHAGNDSCRRALARKKTAACVDGHTRRSCRKSLSLHWLHADFRSSGQGGAPKSCAMRADPSEYKLVSPGNLQGALSLLAAEPAQWLPIAVGTYVMVLYSSGKLPRRFSGYVSHARKVGARNAQAISKVCLAALGQISRGAIRDVRLAMGSVAPVPLRLHETEKVLTGKKIRPSLFDAARNSVLKEIQPIDDIRSTARYRSAVAGSLVAEFLEKLAAEGANA